MITNAARILSTLDTFLETCPDIPEDVPVVVGRQRRGERENTLALEVAIGGEHYLVTVERISDVGSPLR